VRFPPRFDGGGVQWDEAEEAGDNAVVFKGGVEGSERGRAASGESS
jgi:hypothetical protein